MCACDIESVGASMARYQNQPVGSQGCRRRTAITAADAAASATTASAMAQIAGPPLGFGYHGAKPAGQNNCLRYIRTETSALPVRTNKGTSLTGCKAFLPVNVDTKHEAAASASSGSFSRTSQL